MCSHYIDSAYLHIRLIYTEASVIDAYHDIRLLLDSYASVIRLQTILEQEFANIKTRFDGGKIEHHIDMMEAQCRMNNIDIELDDLRAEQHRIKERVITVVKGRGAGEQ